MTTKNVLFICPHGAAKSTAAAALLAREALRRGLDLYISNAGTDPDPAVNPIVVTRLVAEDLPVAPPPRLVSADDLATADIIINIGCDVSELVRDGRVRNWSIPDFSVNTDVTFAAIEEGVAALAGEIGEWSVTLIGDDGGHLSPYVLKPDEAK